LRNIADFKFDQIASPELAINGKIEESQFTDVVGHLQTNANGPDFFQS
jgi:hypothetical protein